jgi:hypothetical protein
MTHKTGPILFLFHKIGRHLLSYQLNYKYNISENKHLYKDFIAKYLQIIFSIHSTIPVVDISICSYDNYTQFFVFIFYLPPLKLCTTMHSVML